MTATRTLPHAPYIDAVAAEFTDTAMTPEQADAFVEDSYDVPWLRGVITLTRRRPASPPTATPTA